MTGGYGEHEGVYEASFRGRTGTIQYWAAITRARMGVAGWGFQVGELLSVLCSLFSVLCSLFCSGRGRRGEGGGKDSEEKQKTTPRGSGNTERSMKHTKCKCNCSMQRVKCEYIAHVANYECELQNAKLTIHNANAN